jgi:hypothetical protein
MDFKRLASPAPPPASAPIVHHKMNSGKKSVAGTECGVRIFQNDTPHVVSYGKTGRSGFRQKAANKF